MSLPSYDDIIEALELPTPVVWERDKRTTRSGIRRMLMAAYVPNYKDPPWHRLWQQVLWVRMQLRHVGVVVPAELWAEDKARLAAKIAASTDVRYPDEKERALRWARR